MSAEIADQINAFLDATHKRNAWIRGAGIVAYVRRSNRRIPSMRHLTSAFDIANVYVNPPGKGRFTSFLETVIKIIEARNIDMIFVELVHNKRFAEHFRRMGWIEDNSDPLTPSFYRFTNPVKQD